MQLNLMIKGLLLYMLFYLIFRASLLLYFIKITDCSRFERGKQRDMLLFYECFEDCWSRLETEVGTCLHLFLIS